MSGQEVWVLADDRAGNVAQALGVAEALEVPFEVKSIRYDRMARLFNAVRGTSLLGVVPDSRQALCPPWPRLVIGAVRRPAPVGRWLKRVSGCRLLQIMDPGWPGRQDFDLIAIPHHDDGDRATLDDAAASGAETGRPSNVIRTLGACHRIVPALLAAEADKWRGRLAHLPGPYLLLVVGGETRDYRFPVSLGRELARGVARLHDRMGGSILVTTSRRTTPDLARAVIDGLPEPRHIYRWEDGGDNPYLGFLALADCVVVTGDSMSMCSEACATPGPVYIFSPDGMVTRKHAALHRLLFEAGYARPLGGDSGYWTHPRLNAAFDVAAAVRARGLLS
ncbi:MAG: nucleoside-diphosphate sugar epimerase [Telmatospirillum sp.]|nr:nucleoside-diphosphate sugar epimerase [Telmatospirillum sp.]